MTRFDPSLHFEFKGKVYCRGGGYPAHGVEAPQGLATLDAGTLKRIHVNRHHIAANRKDGKNRPCYTIKHAGGNIYARRVIIDGPSECVDDTGELSCGARIWIETKSLVYLFDPMSYEEVKTAFADAVMED